MSKKKVSNHMKALIKEFGADKQAIRQNLVDAGWDWMDATSYAELVKEFLTIDFTKYKKEKIKSIWPE